MKFIEIISRTWTNNVMSVIRTILYSTFDDNFHLHKSLHIHFKNHKNMLKKQSEIFFWKKKTTKRTKAVNPNHT